jgi:hypothetical protein
VNARDAILVLQQFDRNRSSQNSDHGEHWEHGVAKPQPKLCTYILTTKDTKVTKD